MNEKRFPFGRSSLTVSEFRDRLGRLKRGEHVAVTVWRNGESVVTIESNCVSGRTLLPGDDEAIRSAAHTLLGFIGDPIPATPLGPELLGDPLTSQLLDLIRLMPDTQTQVIVDFITDMRAIRRT